MKDLPTGTVTFLFTDIEGSTTLLQRLGDRRYAGVLEEHRRLLRDAFAEGHGEEVDTQGDAFLVAFPRARDALAAAVEGQRALTKHAWPEGVSLRVRMGLHTGEPISGSGDYAGLDVHRAARICAAAHGGQILLSDAVSALATRDLPAAVTLRDLGTHRLKDLTEPERLLQVVHPDLPAEFPPLKALDARQNNMPIQLTSFIGREKEITEVKRLLAASRLVTLTGIGGAGKTRLALQVAADLLNGYPDGVWLAELAPLADPAFVPKTVASAVNVPEQPGREIIDTVVDALRAKTLLLVLDNCEHLLAASRDLTATLLRTCPQIRVLATSREGLGVPGETLWRVPSLSVPEDVHHLPPPEELVLYDAVRLFADRAAATAPGFAVTRDNERAIVQVCQRLDGIPLALELAAARAKVLAIEQIAARLDDRFRLLTGGSQTVLPRHQTLGAAIDWSYNLLSETERVMLRRLSVFAGGWTLEAAEAVCSGGVVGVGNILDVLTSLVGKSLVLAEIQKGEARYRLLETVRQYAHDRLVEAGEQGELQTRHRNWYLALAEQTNPQLWWPRSARWVERLEAENDNLRAALEWAKTDKDGAQAGLRLVGTLYPFWYRRGHWREASEWLAGALARRDEAPRTLQPSALIGATQFAWRLGDYALATRLGEEGVALCRELGNKEAHSWLLTYLSTVAIHQGNYDRATALCEEGLNLGRELRSEAIISMQLAHLGIVARFVGDYERATALLNESLAFRKKLGEYQGIAFVLRSLGQVALNQNDSGRAAAYFRESLILSSENGDTWLCEESLQGCAAIASAAGHYQRAARLIGAAERLQEILGWRPSPPTQADYDKRKASTRGALTDFVFETAWAEGRAMTLEQAVEYALAGNTIKSGVAGEPP